MPETSKIPPHTLFSDLSRERNVIPRARHQLLPPLARPAALRYRRPGKHDHDALAITMLESKVAHSHPTLCYQDARCYWSGKPSISAQSLIHNDIVWEDEHDLDQE